MAANGWPPQHRIPAFGGWNYNDYTRDDGDGAGVGEWPPVTPCFDFASPPPCGLPQQLARPAAAQQKSTKRSSMPNARRMRVPAFGEWNHPGDDAGHANGNGSGAWPAVMTPFFDLATATPQKAPKTTVGRRRRGGDGFGAAKLATAADQAPQGHVQTRRSKVADSAAYAAAAATARRSCFTVAKPVDDDLYGVPPDMMLHGKRASRKDGWLRILRLLGCSCLSAS